MALTFLTPKLPPSVCGVGDHTLHMASALREIVPAVTAIVLQPHAVQGADGVLDRVDRWDRSPSQLRRLLQAHHCDVLWIQYSGYGFGYQGLPLFLPRAIRALRPRPMTVVYFHETHCEPYQLGWKGRVVSPLQKQIARAVAQCADVVMTSNNAYRQTIKCDYRVPAGRVMVLPLGANVRVPVLHPRDRHSWREELGWKDDDRVAVSFGSQGSQRAALRRNEKMLLAALERRCIHRIVCIGGDHATGRDTVLQHVDGRIAQSTIVMGHQAAEQVGRVLVAADVALMAHPFDRFGKSGVLMAYSLAGLPVVVDDDPPLVVSKYRGALLVSDSQLTQLDEVMDELDSRADRQKDAAEQYSWSAIARSALEMVATAYPAAASAPPLAGAAT